MYAASHEFERQVLLHPRLFKHHNQGFMYFQHHILILFLHNLNTVVKETINKDGVCKHAAR